MALAEKDSACTGEPVDGAAHGQAPPPGVCYALATFLTNNTGFPGSLSTLP